MLDTIWDFVRSTLGVGNESLNASQMAIRAVITFPVTLAIVRIGDKRIFGKGTAFDIIVSIMIGSVMSRAITGSTPFAPTLVAGTVLVGLHWLVALLAFRLRWFGPLVKGDPVLLIKDGEVQHAGARQGSVTPRDLEQALRAQGAMPDPSQVKQAYLERDGSISVIPRESKPRSFDVTVADGVQTVRIVLE